MRLHLYDPILHLARTHGAFHASHGYRRRSGSHLSSRFVKVYLIWPSQTLQTTTVAAQASVPRRDMAVVTAVRNVRFSVLLQRSVSAEGFAPVRPSAWWDPSLSFGVDDHVRSYVVDIAVTSLID